MHFIAREMLDLSLHFEADALAYSLEHCARICYETGCTQAAYTRFPRPVCLMNYSNRTDCPEGRQNSYVFTKIQEVVELRCLTCGTCARLSFGNSNHVMFIFVLANKHLQDNNSHWNESNILTKLYLHSFVYANHKLITVLG